LLRLTSLIRVYYHYFSNIHIMKLFKRRRAFALLLFA
jgi:hypothetical protein